MDADMSWSPNYCIHCDKETYEAVYCSQSCRLADLEKSAYSSPVTPSYEFSSPTEASLSFSMSRNNRSNLQFQLPPAFNFDAYRGSTSKRMESPPTSPHSGSSNHHQTRQTTRQSHQSTQSHLSTNYSTTNPASLYRSNSDYPHTSQSQSRQRSLNTSTSRSSLSSISSTGTIPGLSDQALSQLQSYANSFDHVRDWKRRTTLG